MHGPDTMLASVGEDAMRLLAECGQVVAYSLEGLRPLLDRLGATRVLLVADRGAVDAACAWDRLERQLAGLAVRRVDVPRANPQLGDAVDAARVADGFRPDAAVAVGGGSCIDIAKLAVAGHAVGVLPDGPDGARGAIPPLIAAPTTSGSGSESTGFAVAYDQGCKRSFVHPHMRPHGVVLDPTLVASMPPRVAAESGLDALAQSLEALWAVGGDDRSDRYAEGAGRLVAPSLIASATRGDAAARVRMMVGACLAGQAINISKTTAPHALSYRLTSIHGVAHGHAVALTLGWVARANAQTGPADCNDPRGPDHVRRQTLRAAALLGSTPDALPLAMHRLLEDLGLPPTLGEAGVPAEAIGPMIDAVNQQRLANNPRRLDREALRGVLCDALRGPF